jgi:endoglucanase
MASSRRTPAALGLLAAAVVLVLTACSSGDGTRSVPTDGPPTSTPTPTPTSQATRVTPDTIRTAPTEAVFHGGIALEPNSLAARAEATLGADGETDASRAAALIAERPVAMWIGDGYDDAQLVRVITDYLVAAERQGATPVFVTYAIPDRDCGNHSAGGLSAERYPAWNATIAATLAGHRAVVIVEPDSLGMLSRCPQLADVRLPLLRQAVADFAAAGVPAYLDGGNSHWVAPEVMADRLEAAGVDRARGFFTNVAGFYPVGDEQPYAEEVAAMTGGSRYVIDVSRNGRGWKGTWCNPDDVGLGQDPRVVDDDGRLDALLWVKTPGISDGTCNGGPAAGEWYPSYAEMLVDRRPEWARS